MTVVDANGEKIQQKFGMTCLRIDDDQGSRRKIVMKDTEESRKKLFF
jgi:hypothetical protein